MLYRSPIIPWCCNKHYDEKLEEEHWHKASLSYSITTDDRIEYQLALNKNGCKNRLIVFQIPYTSNNNEERVSTPIDNEHVECILLSDIILPTTPSIKTDIINYRILLTERFNVHFPIYITILSKRDDTWRHIMRKRCIWSILFLHHPKHIQYLWETHKKKLLTLREIIHVQEYVPNEVWEIIMILFSEQFLMEYEGLNKFLFS